MQNIHRYIDENRDRFLDELFFLLRQPSISTQNQGVTECAHLLQKQMQAIGIPAQVLPTARHPVVLGELRSPTATKTILIYGHYDVQPPEPLELWNSPPFEPTIRDGRIYGRGTGDNKGQLFAHLKAVEAVLHVERQLPVNVKFLFEGEEEISSRNLRAFIEANLAYGVTLADAARHLGVTGRHLNRIFTEREGLPVGEAIAAARLEKARALLRADPGMPTKTVAALCGFGDASYFCRFFRERVGASPTEFAGSAPRPADRRS